MTYYLIDTENVACRWAQFAEKAGTDDVFILFYSKNVGAVSMKLFGPACLRGIRFSFVECHVGPSAMDFQMATELGRLVTLHPDDGYVVVSGDTGFDVVVKYWLARGVRISRECPEVAPKATKAATDKEAPEKTAPGDGPASDAGNAVAVEYHDRLRDLGLAGADLDAALDILTVAMRRPEKDRRMEAYGLFRKRYGKKEGLARYRTVKALVADIAARGPFPPAVPEAPGPAPSPAGKPTADRPGTLDEAVAALGIELSDAQRTKLRNMFRHAKGTKNGRKIYRTQLADSFGAPKGTKIFLATQALL